jgi:hypothetical protein
MNLHLPGICVQLTQTGPEPVLGLARGLRGQGPGLDGYAGPSGPGATETGK